MGRAQLTACQCWQSLCCSEFPRSPCRVSAAPEMGRETDEKQQKRQNCLNLFQHIPRAAAPQFHLAIPSRLTFCTKRTPATHISNSPKNCLEMPIWVGLECVGLTAEPFARAGPPTAMSIPGPRGIPPDSWGWQYGPSPGQLPIGRHSLRHNRASPERGGKKTMQNV